MAKHIFANNNSTMVNSFGTMFKIGQQLLANCKLKMNVQSVLLILALIIMSNRFAELI